jgi:hypothetical protein
MFGTSSESGQRLGARRGKGLLASADSLTSRRRIVTYMVT